MIVCMYVLMYLHSRAPMHSHAHTQTHTPTHTRTHTHTHTQNHTRTHTRALHAHRFGMCSVNRGELPVVTWDLKQPLTRVLPETPMDAQLDYLFFRTELFHEKNLKVSRVAPEPHGSLVARTTRPFDLGFIPLWKALP